jgi:hypothetical protein
VTPPAYQPNDLGAVAPRLPFAGSKSLARSFWFTGGSWNTAGASMTTLNSFLAAYHYSGLHIGPFTGKYAYLYLSSGMQIVVFEPYSLNEFAMNAP